MESQSAGEVHLPPPTRQALRSLGNAQNEWVCYFFSPGNHLQMGEIE